MMPIQTTWEKIKRQDAEAEEAAKILRIKEREFQRDRQIAQQHRDYYEKTKQTQESLSKRIAQMGMKSTPLAAVEASVSVKTKQVVEDPKPKRQEVDVHSQDPLVIFLDNKLKTKSLTDRLLEEKGIQSFKEDRKVRELPTADELRELGG